MLYLASLPPIFPASPSAITLSEHIKQIHEEVRKTLEATYCFLRDNIDLHRREKKFKEGE